MVIVHACEELLCFPGVGIGWAIREQYQLLGSVCWDVYSQTLIVHQEFNLLDNKLIKKNNRCNNKQLTRFLRVFMSIYAVWIHGF